MYLARAEDLIDYWAEEARGSAHAGDGGGKRVSMAELARQFGGKAMPGKG